MDTFMDKLDQKLNAQEMIRANTTAELEELAQVKEQIQELKNCVSQMQTAAQQMQSENHAYTERMENLVKENAGRDLTAPAGSEDVIYILEEEVSQLGKDFAQFKESLTGFDGHPSQNVKEITGLGESVAQIKEEMNRSREELSGMREEITGTREELAGTREEIAGTREELAGTREEIAGTREELAVIRENTSDREITREVSEKVEQFYEEFSRYQQEFDRHRSEMEQLREEIRSFREEVSRMQEAQNGDEDVIEELRKEMSQLEERLTGISQSSAARNAETMDALKRFLIDQLEKLRSDQSMSGAQKAALEEQKALLEELKIIQEENKNFLENKMTGVHEGLREGYHKECVKVYRNVQAAFIEENEKQTNRLEQVMDKLRGRVTGAMLFSVLAFVAALAGLVLQIISLL